MQRGGGELNFNRKCLDFWLYYEVAGMLFFGIDFFL